MEISIRQLSSLEKVRDNKDFSQEEIERKVLLAGERFSYQICIKSEERLYAAVSVESAISDNIKLYCVRDAYMDAPVTEDVPDEDYITLDPGYMPDILVPVQDTQGRMTLDNHFSTIWVRIDIPTDLVAGVYPVKVKVSCNKRGGEFVGAYNKEMSLEILPTVIQKQQLIYTRWLYLDCIAQAHHVEVFSEEHWKLIDKYIAAAVDVGVNMMLVPVHTPPLDTEIGQTRTCVQLIDIEKKGQEYTFGFDKFDRYIEICQRNGIQYYEIAHMFSQWGAKFTPNILVTENGKTEYKFGWHVQSSFEEYTSFLKQYIAAISEALTAKGISQNTYFHVSDEPDLSNIETYEMAANIIRPLIGNSKTFDALSDYEFYQKGMVECPVTRIDHINEFLPERIDNQWVYCCCHPQTVYPNSFMAMPSYRIRILGFLMYKYQIKGFLQWGFNYYNAFRSLYTINPYLTTSGDRAYPSGDAFIVYPGADTVHSSIRGEIMYEAIQDINLCNTLELVIGRDAVTEMIDRSAGGNLRFEDYPRDKSFIETLREDMTAKLKEKMISV